MIASEVLRDCTHSPSLLISKCESALDLRTNTGDQDFHLLMEGFGLAMRDALQKGEVDFVAFSLASSFARAVKSERHGEEITAMLGELVSDLIESSDALSISIQGQGMYGKILAKQVLLEDRAGRTAL